MAAIDLLRPRIKPARTYHKVLPDANATVGSVLEHQNIVELPLNERRFNLLATLAPRTSTTMDSGV